MNKILKLLLGIVLLAVGTSSCQNEETPVNYGEVLRGKWEKSIVSTDYSAEVSIYLTSTYTYTYNQDIDVDGEKIHNSISGSWEFNEGDNTIRLLLNDSKENIQHEEVGKVNIEGNTITIDGNVFTRAIVPK